MNHSAALPVRETRREKAGLLTIDVNAFNVEKCVILGLKLGSNVLWSQSQDYQRKKMY